MLILLVFYVHIFLCYIFAYIFQELTFLTFGRISSKNLSTYQIFWRNSSKFGYALQMILITLFKSDSETYFFKLSNGPQNGKQNNSEELKIVQKFKNYSVTSPSPSPKKPQLLITRFTRLLLALIPHHIKTCSAGWLSLFFLHVITTYLAWTKHYFLLSHKVTISIYEKNICFDKQHNRS